MVKVGHGRRDAPSPVPVAWNPSRREDDIEVVPLSWISAHLPPGQFERPEFHILTLHAEGRTHHEVDFVSHACGPGTLVHVAPGQVHRFSLGAGVSGLSLLFPPTMLPPARSGSLWRPELFEQLAWPTRLALDEVTRRAATRSFARVRELATAHTPGAVRAELLVCALGVALLDIAGRAGLSPRTRGSGGEAAKLARAFHDAVERSFRVTRSVTEYARALSCTPRTLDRLARGSFGVTAKAQIDQRVFLEARRLLVHTNDSIAQIADDLGFSEATNFGKFYEARTGVSPGHFRRSRLVAPRR